MGFADTLNLDPDFSDVTSGSSSVSLDDPFPMASDYSLPDISDPTSIQQAGLGSSIGGLVPYIGPAIQGFRRGGSSAGGAIARGAGSAARGALDFITGGYRTRPRHRMNVLNPHALRRSIRRVQGFEKFARQVVYITRGPGYRVSAFRHGHPKRRGHRRRRCY